MGGPEGAGGLVGRPEDRRAGEEDLQLRPRAKRWIQEEEAEGQGGKTK